MLPGTYRDDDPEGLKRDVLVDARIEVQDAKHRLQKVYVDMDSLADDNEGIWTDDERKQIRAMQRDAEALVSECEDNLDDINEALDELDL